MDAVGVDLVGRLVVGRDLGEVDKVLGLARDLLPEGGAVVGLEAVAEDLDAAAVVHAGDGLHEVRGGMVAEVGAHVADAESLACAMRLFQILFDVEVYNLNNRKSMAESG